jgi:alpha-beta hydrolase superfamily lysophospholipase
MYSRKEGFFKGFKDVQLYYQRWIPENVQGNLIITHGHGEHSDCYARVVDALDGKGWSVFAWDWRGHGRSDGQRGYAADFNEYCYDFEAFLKYLKEQNSLSDKPTVLLAHSMGGLIQLKTLLSHLELQFAAQVLSSPFLGVAVDVPAYKQVGAQLLIRFLPKVTLSNEISPTFLSRDPAIIEEFQEDVLRHNRICSAVYLGALESFDFVQQRADKLNIPTLFQISDKDQVASSIEMQKFFDHVECEKVLKIYAGHKHELYNDLGREKVFQDLNAFLDKYLK